MEARGRGDGRAHAGSGRGQDSEWFAIVLLGVPVLLATLSVGFERITGRAWSGIAWLAAILAMAWAVLLTLGIGASSCRRHYCSSPGPPPPRRPDHPERSELLDTELGSVVRYRSSTARR